jgi:hypothetical protein
MENEGYIENIRNIIWPDFGILTKVIIIIIIIIIINNK